MHHQHAAPPLARAPARRLTRALSLGGAITAALAASACCIGPLLLALLGIGGAGALIALEPYRPAFAAVTLTLLGAGWYLTYRTPAKTSATNDECGCELPRANKAGERMLWLATGLVAVALLFPYLVPYLF
jgi:mercuric ion transport protein